jgi:3-hydroxyacyl-CoA dehydrogenase
MAKEIKRVAVLGAGVMGQGIAAHLANAGIDSVLFDMVPKGVGEDATASERIAMSIAGIKNALKAKPAAFFCKEFAERITPANYDDHGALLGECDLIIEVVVERLDIKHHVFAWVSEHRKAGSILASNTSGLSIADMAGPMSDELKKHFLVMHFFNPVRYMRLLELVSGEATLPEVTEAVAKFGEKVLGKGIVYAKDTPNFIANRIGTFGICSVFHHMERLGLTVEAVDAIFGKAMGRPNSAVFRTADLVGIDTLRHVLNTVYNGCENDERRDLFQSPSWLDAMIEAGALGSKSGMGFYKKIKVKGKSVILVRDLATGEYREQEKVRFESTGKARKAGSTKGSIRALVSGKDVASELAWAATADTLIYAANRVPEIADDIVNIDRGMCWGFGWKMGPFETWDVIGVRKSVERMESEGREVPAWVKSMLESGQESFYERDSTGANTFWNQGAMATTPSSDGWLILSDLKAKGGAVESNHSATLYDLGDEIACLSFHSKMNAIDDGIIGLYTKALDQLDDGKWRGLVVGNQGGSAFCAGANLFMVAMASLQKQWDQLEGMISALQNVCDRALYSSKPVVTAPWGLTLGGGCEIAMQSSATVASGELYMGLVEVGVGVIPAGGGCKEMLRRSMGGFISGTEYDPNPFIQAVFKNIGMAEVAKSAEEARNMGYLRATDQLTLDPDALIMDAKMTALGMANANYKAPRRSKFKVPGRSGLAAIQAYLYQMHEGGFITDHDLTVAGKLAWVLTGGDVPSGTVVDEQYMLDLERQAFMSLCGESKTTDRIQHMLSTGKPLRN